MKKSKPAANSNGSSAAADSRGKVLRERVLDNGHRKPKRIQATVGALGSPGRFFVGTRGFVNHHGFY